MTDTLPVRIDQPSTEPLLSTVYTSTATVHFAELDLALLLAISRSNNESRGLTGLLVYRDGQFMQALEGPERAVRTALATIAADPRHTHVRTLDERRIAERRFGSWAMGYRAAPSADAEASPAWFGSPDALSRRADSHADELLAWFQDL